MLLYKINGLKTNIFSSDLRKIECSSNKTQWQFLARDDALTQPWIRINSPLCSSVLVVDIDPQQYSDEVIKQGIKIAPPNYIIESPVKEKSLQLGYILQEPTWRNNLKEWGKFEDVRHKLNLLFSADLQNKNTKAKNPFCGFWTVKWVSLERYNLNELSFALREKQEKEEIAFNYLNKTETVKNTAYKYDPNSANCANFDYLRVLAYEWCETYKEVFSPEEFPKALFAFLKTQEDPKIYKNQTPAERKTTINSIVKFCTTTYKSSNCGKYARINHFKKDMRMKAIEYIKSNYNLDLRVTSQQKEDIAKALKISIKTVANYITIAKKTDKKPQTNGEMILTYKEKNLLSFPEIAKILNMSESAIKRAYYREKSKQKKDNP